MKHPRNFVCVSPRVKMTLSSAYIQILPTHRRQVVIVQTEESMTLHGCTEIPINKHGKFNVFFFS